MPLDDSSARSVRYYSEDGHLHVRVSNISKAMVCPYHGSEIPGAEQLGLDPGRVYYLLRDPDELARAAPTFAGKQILLKHIHVTADSPENNKTVGATGSDCRFEFPYLKSSLSIWDGGGIALIESEAQRELSASYHYDPDMTPGEWRGVLYDGVMRNIRGNHVALVEDGRAGSDVVVMDAAMSEDPRVAGSPLRVSRYTVSQSLFHHSTGERTMYRSNDRPCYGESYPIGRDRPRPRVPMAIRVAFDAIMDAEAPRNAYDNLMTFLQERLDPADVTEVESYLEKILALTSPDPDADTAQDEPPPFPGRPRPGGTMDALVAKDHAIRVQLARSQMRQRDRMTTSLEKRFPNLGRIRVL